MVYAMKRVKLRFAGLTIDFVDREQALNRVLDWADKGVSNVKVVFGPEGCGKTAWLRQSAELLKGLGFDVIYFNPVEREVFIELELYDLRKEFLRFVEDLAKSNAFANIA